MKMLYKRRCPKCGGNLYFDQDYYGHFEACLQCGYARDIGAKEFSEASPATKDVIKASLRN